MRRFFSRLAFLLPIPLIVVATNLWVDPGNLKDEGPFEAMAASIMLSGKNVGNLKDCNERLLVKNLIEGLPAAPDVVVMGSSRTMLIGSGCFTGKVFFNSSISGAQLEDFLGIYNLLRRRSFTPERVVLGLDGSLLNPGHVQYRWNSLADEYHEMDALLGFESERRFALLGPRQRYLEFASPSYFRESLTALALHGGLEHRFWATEETAGPAQMRMSDGSLVYGDDVRRRGVDEVTREAMKFATKSRALFGLSGFSEIDEARLARLDRFVGYLRKRGIHVSLFVPPYHPIVFKVISSDPSYAMVLESETRYRELAAKHGLELVGGYDPEILKVSGSDFHDGMHLRSEVLTRILDCGKPASDR